MSKEKKKKVIHVDELIIHANEVKIISPQIKDDIKSRNPLNSIKDRPSPYLNLDQVNESSSKDHLLGAEQEIKLEEGAQRRGRPWWM